MRLAALTLIGSLALTTAGTAANAAPAIPQIGAQPASNVIAVSGGCGPAFHRNPWGYCAPNYYGWYGYRPYYAWGGYHPRWRYWHGHY